MPTDEQEPQLDVSSTMSDLKSEFDREIASLYEQVKERIGHKPTVLKSMVDDYGSVKAAKMLLYPSGEWRKGFQNLIEHNALDLSVECLVLNKRLQPLFEKAEIEAARKRLRKYGLDTSIYEDG